jgi:BirA family biotin operon repressor/biotin-[acetyl-CoA-carboxylase] ligase
VFDEAAIRAALRELPLGGLRVYRTIGSTNDEALAWAAQGAADLSVVVSDEQTSGRGRSGRNWATPAGSAIAASVIIQGATANRRHGRLAGLGALAIAEACDVYGLRAKIKWPNDVLLNGRKVGGVLVEIRWHGDLMESAVIGMGINILRGSAPRAGDVAFPATCIEDELGRPADRLGVLRATVASLISWLARLQSDEFLKAWEERLAFRGGVVTLRRDSQPPIVGSVEGLEGDGSLRLGCVDGFVSVPMGEVHLLPSDDRMH